MKYTVILVISALCMALLASCVEIKSDPNSSLSNNAPADWERTTFGVPL